MLTEISYEQLLATLCSDEAWDHMTDMFKNAGCYCPPPYCTGGGC